MMGGWVKENFDFYELQRIMFKLLETVEVFAGFTQAELVELLSASEKCTFQEGETILSEGSIGNFMYILIEGEVKIVKGREKDSSVLAKLGSGGCFGEMTLVDNDLRSATVFSVSPCVLIRLNESSFARNHALSAKLYRNIARQLSRRLRNTNAMISLGLKD